MADLYFLVLGLCLGSFIHTVSYRTIRDISLFRRSRCDACEQPTAVWTLIPVVGYLLLRGKCRQCGYTIPQKYPLIELLNGLLVWFIWMRTGWNLTLLFELLIWESLLLIALTDFETMHIYWAPVVFCFAARGAMIYTTAPDTLSSSLMGMFAGAGIFHFISYFYTIIRRRVGLGEGDATLMGLLGFVLTWQSVIPVIFMASAVGIVMVLTTAAVMKKSLRDAFPFGPALITAGFILYFFPDILRVLPLTAFKS